MIDTSTSWLIEKMRENATLSSVWFSDENVLRQLPDSSAWQQKPTLFTNRWDIFIQAQAAGFTCHFNDFVFAELADESVDHIFYRISKEKAVSHHLINQAHRLLKPGGQLWLCGQKNEGIKTYIEKATAMFGDEKNIQKDGFNYSSVITKHHLQAEQLPDDDYSRVRSCLEINGKVIFSKPGQFGWSKIDQGSEFLINEISQRLNNHGQFERCLDLGCGYGYLTIASCDLPIKTRFLTDNNAAALHTAEFNCKQLGIPATLVASDAGVELPPGFDLILCNPPFHQGFNIDGDLTDKFLRNTQRLLSKNGVAYFVVNQFIPLEKKAEPLFTLVKLFAQNKSFKLVELRNA